MHRKRAVIAFCGKGGVGKTSLSAMTVKLLASMPGSRVLAIDADPATGLALALGMPVTRTVDDIRNEIIRRVKEGTTTGPEALVALLDYEMMAALGERKNLAFLAIGRPEKEGCYCQINHLLKEIIATIADSFDYVVIDGEAGVEQVNRRVMEKVSHLALVSDASAKGLNVVKTLGEVAGDAIGYERQGLILNRLKDEGELQKVKLPEGIELMGWIPEDETVRACDIEDKSLLEAEGGSALPALALCLANLGIIDLENQGSQTRAVS